MGALEITSCEAVTDEIVREALAPARRLSDPGPKDKTLALVRRMVEIAKPGSGAPRLLYVLAQMAKRSWLDGDLVVKLIGDSELSVIELMVDDGLSRERIWGPERMDVPLAELASVVRHAPDSVLPLRATEAPTDRRIVLRGTRDHSTQKRKESISAFDSSLLRAVSGESSGAKPPPPPRRSSPPAAGELGVYERAVPTLEIPEELDDRKRR